MQGPNVTVTGDAPEREVLVLGCRLVICSIANHHVRALPAKPCHDPLEATLLASLCCTVDILNGEHLSQSKEQHLGQSRNQLRCRDQDIDAVLSLRDHIQTLHHQAGPVVRRLFNL